MSLGLFLFLALGGALILEGFVWAAFPGAMRRTFNEAINNMDDRTLHIGGTVAVVTGVVIVTTIFKFLV